jgi:hypothetical protein
MRILKEKKIGQEDILPAYLLDVRSIAGESPIAASNDKPSLFFIFSRWG